jgi:hypothetical protein
VYFKVKPEHRDSYAREVHILKEDTLWIEVRKAPNTLPNVYPFNRESFLDILKEISVYS